MPRIHIAAATLAASTLMLTSALTPAGAAPRQPAAPKTRGDLAWVTTNNVVKLGRVSSDGKVSAVRRLGPVTKADPHHFVEIRDLSASGDGAWIAWMEEQAKHGSGGALTKAKVTIVLRNQTSGKTTTLVEKDAGIIGFAGDTLVFGTQAAHSMINRVVFTPKPHTVSTRINDRTDPLVPTASGVIELVVEKNTGKKLKNRLISRDFDGTTTTLHTYTLAGDATRPPESAYNSLDDEVFAIERGDHTDFGGVGPSSDVDLFTDGGKTLTQLGHFGTAKAEWRVQDMAFSGSGHQPWAAFTTTHNSEQVTADVAEYVDNQWKLMAKKAISVCADSSSSVVVQPGHYAPVKSQAGPQYRLVPDGSALLFGDGAVHPIKGVKGTEFVRAG